MTDQEQDSAETEAAPQVSDPNVSEQAAKEVQDTEAVKKAEDQEKNWRAMRQRQKEMEFELKQKSEMLDRFMQMQQPAQAVQAKEEPEVDDSEYVSAGGVKGIARKTVQPLEKKIQDLEARLAQNEQQKLIGSLKSQFPDFDDVVNLETLEILEKTEPELALAIASSKDPYKMGIQSYKYIKALGLVETLPTAKRAKEIEKKIEKNAKTVQSPMAFDKRPMAQAFKSTAADNKRLYEEMMFYAGQASGL